MDWARGVRSAAPPHYLQVTGLAPLNTTIPLLQHTRGLTSTITPSVNINPQLRLLHTASVTETLSLQRG